MNAEIIVSIREETVLCESNCFMMSHFLTKSCPFQEGFGFLGKN